MTRAQTCDAAFYEGTTKKLCARVPGHEGKHSPYLDVPVPMSEQLGTCKYWPKLHFEGDHPTPNCTNWQPRMMPVLAPAEPVAGEVDFEIRQVRLRDEKISQGQGLRLLPPREDLRSHPSEGEEMTIRSLAESEKEQILEAILATGGVVDAAKALGIGKTTIYDKLKRYNLKTKANEIVRELRRQQKLPIIPESGSMSKQ